MHLGIDFQNLIINTTLYSAKKKKILIQVTFTGSFNQARTKKENHYLNPSIYTFYY